MPKQFTQSETQHDQHYAHDQTDKDKYKNGKIIRQHLFIPKPLKSEFISAKYTIKIRANNLKTLIFVYIVSLFSDDVINSINMT
tara:strand:+ start:19 stop:270 length:252 start_codon:yes stop_codon:yes gene_type:complete